MLSNLSKIDKQSITNLLLLLSSKNTFSQEDINNLSLKFNDESRTILRAIKSDIYLVVKLTAQLQKITNQSFPQYMQHIQHSVAHNFPSKSLLLQCLSLQQQEISYEIMKQLPNSMNDPLIYCVFNKLITNHTLDYRESTTVLTFLHNKKLLKTLFNEQVPWVQLYATQSWNAISQKNIKNYALLSRIYSDTNISQLYKLAHALSSLKWENGSQFSYVTLFQSLSILKDQSSLLQRLASMVKIDAATDNQILIQMLIGAMQANLEFIAQNCFRYIVKKDNLTQQDKLTILLAGVQFKLYTETEIQQLTELYELMKQMQSKQLGEFSLNLNKNYCVDLTEFYKSNCELITNNNLINIYLATKLKDLEEKIIRNIQNKTIEFGGLVKLLKILDLSQILSQMIEKYEYDDIKHNVKEIASILIYLDQKIDYLNNLPQYCIEAVEQGQSTSQGLGNILYIASKKQLLQNESTFQIRIKDQLIKQIIKEADPLELINLLKALDNLKILNEEYSKLIKQSIQLGKTEQNSSRVERNLKKIPQHLQC